MVRKWPKSGQKRVEIHPKWQILGGTPQHFEFLKGRITNGKSDEPPTWCPRGQVGGRVLGSDFFEKKFLKMAFWGMFV